MSDRLSELVQRLRSGKATAADIEEIARAHEPTVKSIAKYYSRRAPHMYSVFVAEGFYGVAVALNEAQAKLYDDNITPYIRVRVRRYIHAAYIEDRTVPVPWSVKTGQEITLPKLMHNESIIPSHYVDLFELKDMIQSCIKSQFEEEVVKLRELGLTDEEVAARLSCSRVSVLYARQNVHQRFEKKYNA
jgi:hypothetical protein